MAIDEKSGRPMIAPTKEKSSMCGSGRKKRVDDGIDPYKGAAK